MPMQKLFLVIVPLSEREFLSFHKKSVSKYEAILKGSPYCMGLYKYKQGILIKNKQLEELLERLQFSGQDILALPFIRECRLKESWLSASRKYSQSSERMKNIYATPYPKPKTKAL
jgi:hypothetical protein